MPSADPQAYVRFAKASEFAAVTRVLTCAFAQDPAMNWYGCVAEMVDDVDTPSPSSRRTMRNLHWFQTAIAKATELAHGVVTVVAIPRTSNSVEAAVVENNAEAIEESDNEEIVAVALWLPPGQTMDMGPLTVLRSGILKVLFGWGFTGVKVFSLRRSVVVHATD